MKIPKTVEHTKHCLIKKPVGEAKIPHFEYVMFSKISTDKYSFMFLTGKEKGKIFEATKNSSGECKYNEWITQGLNSAEKFIFKSLNVNVSDLKTQVNERNEICKKARISQVNNKYPFDLTNKNIKVPKLVGCKEYCKVGKYSNGSLIAEQYARYHIIDKKTCIFQFLTGDFKGLSYKIIADANGEFSFNGYTASKTFDLSILRDGGVKSVDQLESEIQDSNLLLAIKNSRKRIAARRALDNATPPSKDEPKDNINQDTFEITKQARDKLIKKYNNNSQKEDCEMIKE